MATSANRSRIFPARSRKSYRLEMEGRTLYLLLTLMVLTGVVVFYLGLVTGKAMRDPNTTVALSAELRTPGLPGAGDGAQPARRELAFSDALKGKDPLIEGLRTEGESAAQKTQSLLKEGDRQLELKEVAVPSPKAILSTPTATVSSTGQGTPKPSARTEPSSPVTVTPAAPPTDTIPGDLYTVQVFTSRFEKNARDLVDRLRNQGFSAYLNRYQSSKNQVLYRVRVGRTSKPEADALLRRLKSEAGLKEPQIRKL